MRSRAALAALVLLKAIVSGLVLASGFTAISDDDFARVVIAQQFAHTTALDPSGTSWLPLPFWLYGLPMLAFGRTWAVARVTAFCLGLLSVVLVWSAARLLGASRKGAFAGAAIAAMFPYSAWLGVATVPELPTASLILWALAASSRAAKLASSKTAFRREHYVLSGFAVLAITAATASRYEAWPIALGMAAWILAGTLNTSPAAATVQHVAGRSAAALGCLSFPLAWIAHGSVNHGDPFFFVQRVTDYKRALAAPASSWLEILTVYPEAFVRGEPELVLLAVALLLATGWGNFLRRAGGTRPFVDVNDLVWRKPALLLLLLLLLLIAGDIRGGGPTHHPERALLTGWLLFAVLAGDAMARVRWGALLNRYPLATGLSGLAMTLMLLGAHQRVRRADLHVGTFAQRTDELDIGARSRHRVPSSESLVVATEDYGYFAIAAAFGAPERIHVLDRHDPRSAPNPEPASERLAELARSTESSWAIVPHSWSHRVAPQGTSAHVTWPLAPLEENSRFSLVPWITSPKASP